MKTEIKFFRLFLGACLAAGVVLLGYVWGVSKRGTDQEAKSAQAEQVAVALRDAQVALEARVLKVKERAGDGVSWWWRQELESATFQEVLKQFDGRLDTVSVNAEPPTVVKSLSFPKYGRESAGWITLGLGRASLPSYSVEFVGNLLPLQVVWAVETTEKPHISDLDLYPDWVEVLRAAEPRKVAR